MSACSFLFLWPSCPHSFCLKLCIDVVILLSIVPDGLVCPCFFDFRFLMSAGDLCALGTLTLVFFPYVDVFNAVYDFLPCLMALLTPVSLFSTFSSC